jgi:hypothetical protein
VHQVVVVSQGHQQTPLEPRQQQAVMVQVGLAALLARYGELLA